MHHNPEDILPIGVVTALYSFSWRLGFLDIVTVEWSGVGVILFCFIFETCDSEILPCTILANMLVGTIFTLGTGSGIVICGGVGSHEGTAF